jgi:hypothetical protein
LYEYFFSGGGLGDTEIDPMNGLRVYKTIQECLDAKEVGVRVVCEISRQKVFYEVEREGSIVSSSSLTNCFRRGKGVLSVPKYSREGLVAYEDENIIVSWEGDVTKTHLKINGPNKRVVGTHTYSFNNTSFDDISNSDSDVRDSDVGK